MSATGLFPSRPSNGGPRPRLRKASLRQTDAAVAEYLSQEWSLDRIAAHMGLTRCTVDGAFKRICRALGDQAL